jgi:hypothetical protein
MKLLKKGRDENGWSVEASCSGEGNEGGGCGALLLVEQADLFRTSSSARDETTYYTTFRCPECHVMTDIKDVPRHVTSNMKTKHEWFQHTGIREP